MKFKVVCLSLFGILFLLLLNEITAIANHDQTENLITDEERRGVPESPHSKGEQGPSVVSEKLKRGLLSSEILSFNHQPHYPTSGHSEYSSYGSPSGSGPGTGYGYSGGVGQSSGYGSFFGHEHDRYPMGGHGYEGHHPYISHGGGHSHSGHKHLALKGLLIPLAGIALLGAAAALSTNPVLLQLGVVNGKRRKRSLHSDVYPNPPSSITN